MTAYSMLYLLQLYRPICSPFTQILLYFDTCFGNVNRRKRLFSHANEAPLSLNLSRQMHELCNDTICPLLS